MEGERAFRRGALTTSHYVSDLTHIQQGDDKSVIVASQSAAAATECQRDANNELTWQIPVDLVAIAWLVVWRRRWSQAKKRDDAARLS